MHRWHVSEWSGERGYPWFSWSKSSTSRKTITVFCLIVVAALLFSHWYTTHSSDLAPDSSVGYLYALLGTGCFLAAFICYWRKRRSHQRKVGALNKSLNWHTLFGLLGLFFLLLHSFGNFNPRSGTYALYGMIGLVVSGIVGRILDRLLPKLATQEVSLALTAQGEDRIDTITRKLDVLASQRPSTSLPMPGFPTVSRSGEVRTLVPYQMIDPVQQKTDEQILVLHSIHQAMHREQCYRYIIRYWRLFHRVLALLTGALTIWHLIYAAQLLLGK